MVKLEPLELPKMPDNLLGLCGYEDWVRCLPYFDCRTETDIENYLVQRKAEEDAEPI